MGDALSSLEDLYFTLLDQASMLTAATSTQADRDLVAAKVVAARTAYWSCVNKMFHDDDPQVISLTTELKGLTEKVKDSDAQLGEISKVIDNITQAVTIAQKLAGLVAV